MTQQRWHSSSSKLERHADKSNHRIHIGSFTTLVSIWCDCAALSRPLVAARPIMEKKRAASTATGPGTKRARGGKATGQSNGSKASCATGSAAAAGPMDIEELATFTEEELSAIRCNLLDWYDANHRVLPWRRNPRSRLGPAALAAAAAAGVAPAPSGLPLNEFM